MAEQKLVDWGKRLTDEEFACACGDLPPFPERVPRDFIDELYWKALSDFVFKYAPDELNK